MYKIRLYVVPEQEEKSEDAMIDEDYDFMQDTPPMMQRKNSKRPGAVRLNVIQKDRKTDAIAPKLKQFCHKINKNETQMQVLSPQKNFVVTRTPSNGHPTRNSLQKENQSAEENNNSQKVSEISKNVSALPHKNVFASPKIKQLALNLQERMMERSTKLQQQDGAKQPSVPESDQVDNFQSQISSPDRVQRNINAIALSPVHGIQKEMTNYFLDTGVGFVRPKQNDSRIGEVSVRQITDFGGENEVNINAIGAINNNQGSEPRKVDNFGGGSVIMRRNNKLNRYREYDLEQKIEVEIKMREGSARLLAAARHRAQSLEAARALLTSNERMSAYMAELQRRKKEPTNKPSLPASTARVSLSELRVPLMWRDSDHFKNRGDYRRFAVFCLARVGTEIHDTALLCPVDRALTDISFPDVLVFNNVPAEFEVTLEIYSHILQEDLSIASTPRRIKRTIHSSISRTVGKKLAASLRDELNSGKIGPHFELMASARLTLDDTDDNIHTHDLVINNLENKNHALPLFGHFCCRLAAQPECFNKEACSGNIILDGRSCWTRLQGFTLQAWESRKLADEEQSPCNTVPVNRETLIQPSKSSSKELRISNTVEGSDKITTIRLESSEDAQRWLRQLVTHAKDHLRWKHAAESIQEVPCAESARNSFISNKRQGSLYDETPLIESVQSDYNSASRPTVQEIFGLTPSTSLSSCSSTNSPPSLRSRSLSTSGQRKISSSTLRSHWPFSNKSHE